MGCVQGRGKLERSGLREEVLLFSFQATPRWTSVAERLDKRFIAGDERLTRYPI
jgi:hypothetical protein